MTPSSWKDSLIPALSLFTSAGTLLCCALPALMVSLGAGAALAGLVSAAPWLVVLSAHKTWIFAVAGGMILVGGALRWRARHAPCPADPAAARACRRLRRISAWIYWLSVSLYLVGAFFAFLAPRWLV
jgi:hypothetical protein